jgi:hypothetical protein
MPDFESSDAWLLLAIKYAQEKDAGASVDAIVKAGDFINHAIFTDEELNEGLKRLKSAGYLLEIGGLISVSDKFHASWEEHGVEKHRAVAKQLGIVEKMLNVT